MNITQITKLAGVSNATVSRFLNQGYVSEEARAKYRK
ncbi:LacI family DNA-binding transcriptional regulator [Cellulosilyticum ruminicola]|nr:LacI family DNA-binding transcriptional regulator [Cellulosilyticum ruminicola]